MRQRAAHPFSMAWKKYFHTVEKSVQSCSIVWKNRAKCFHCVENPPKVYPACAGFFHCVEKSRKVCRCARYGSLARPAAPGAIELAFAHRPSGLGSALAYFPLRGKISPHFSTLWKKDFHTVEKCEARP